ncbi:MAG: HAD family hydrolase [Muribaculaceae bacterium]
MDIAHSIIAFDLDDTLYSERAEYAAQCLHHVAQHLGLDAATECAMIHSRNPYDTLTQAGVSVSLDRFKELYRSTELHPMQLRSDAAHLLRTLRTDYPEVPLYLITDGDSRRQRAKIAALGLQDYFADSHIIISEEIGHDKHSPMPFVHAMARENRADGWVYVGDNIRKDFHHPNRLGWTTIMLVDDGSNVHPQSVDVPADFRPQFTIKSLTEILCQQL